MKGQYLAIESVLTLGIGLALATGTITIFNDYKQDVLATGEEKQAVTVSSRVQSAFNNLKGSTRGEVEIELPEELGGKNYQVTATDRLIIDSREGTYTYELPSSSYNYSGSVTGGSVKVFKREDQFILRPG